MFIIKNPELIRKKILSLKLKGKKIGLVPTMGCLHEGHLSLIAKARKECDVVAVSIFVNPAQFGPKEDLSRYPRDMKRDISLLKASKADFAFVPDARVVYGAGHSVYVTEDRLSLILCGRFRPGHFRGVLTVVAKLFNILLPDRAYFGQKDLQQAYLITKMAKELNYSAKVIVCPVIREKSRLAMSSRNIYLSEKEKEKALVLKRSIDAIIDSAKKGAKDINRMRKQGLKILSRGASRIDYLEVVELPDFCFRRNIQAGRTYAVLCAAYIGKTRLIDNDIFKG
jgi:pantoate--beta-alanine ligase